MRSAIPRCRRRNQRYPAMNARRPHTFLARTGLLVEWRDFLCKKRLILVRDEVTKQTPALDRLRSLPLEPAAPKLLKPYSRKLRNFQKGSFRRSFFPGRRSMLESTTLWLIFFIRTIREIEQGRGYVASLQYLESFILDLDRALAWLGALGIEPNHTRFGKYRKILGTVCNQE
jgi:hypothetical protein